MSEFRADPLFGNPCLIVPEKATRPNRVRVTQASPRAQSVHLSHPLEDQLDYPGPCPYCPGNEAFSPPEIYRTQDLASASPNRWQTRVFAHRHPAMKLEAPDLFTDLKALGHSEALSALLTSKPGFGVHEVIVESPNHNAPFWEMDVERSIQVFKTLQKRMSDLYQDRRLLYVQLFKNHQTAAGTHHEHPHFELLGMPFIPEPVMRLNSARECQVCEVLRKEEPDLMGQANRSTQNERMSTPPPRKKKADLSSRRAHSERFMTATTQFVALMDYAPEYDYQFSIYPSQHHSNFQDATEDELRDLSRLVSQIFTRLNRLLGEFALNIVIFSAPNPLGFANPGSSSMHWFVRVYPRLIRKTGFEIATGIPVVRVAPEDAARAFREKEL